jgi:CelD/BcsL family acetyltransferase involved in cellulose biosynthesis
MPPLKSRHRAAHCDPHRLAPGDGAAAATPTLDTRFLVELDSLEHLYAEWDALALSSELPLMAPGWLMAWWRHLAPKDALLRVVEIRDGTELVGLAPFFAVPSRGRRQIDYHLLGFRLAAPLAPLSQPGREREVAAAIGHALGHASPRPDLIVLQAIPSASRWHRAVSDGWPGRIKPISFVYRTQPYPTVWLQGASLEAWLASRSSKFRSSMRRLKKLSGEERATWRMSVEDTLRGDVESFQRLHAARWRTRGRSSFTVHGQRMVEMLYDAGRVLIGDERFRLLIMEIDGQPIAADIYLCGGGIVTGIGSGWNERWKRLSPPLLATMHIIEDSIKRGDVRLDMGAGDETHKTRFANGNSPLVASVLMPPGRRLARTLARSGPTLADSAARDFAKRALKPEQVDMLRDLRRRVRR